jgi:hypothetical protein
MSLSKNEIIGKFLKFIQSSNGPLGSWYVGVSQDAEKRLFVDHNVNKETGLWIYENADNANEANGVESFFIARGAAGGPGGADYTATMVYAYKKNYNTKP